MQDFNGCCLWLVNVLPTKRTISRNYDKIRNLQRTTCFFLERRMKRFLQISINMFYGEHTLLKQCVKRQHFQKGFIYWMELGWKSLWKSLWRIVLSDFTVFKKAWCNFHSVVNTTTWEWTRRHSEWNHEMQRERDFPPTLIDLPACARTHRNFSFCHWTEDLWYVLRMQP